MTLSVFDVYKIGLGPSSSHTIGPMLAARAFIQSLRKMALLNSVQKVEVEFYGSLALTGRGHCSDRAVILGLVGETPEDLIPERGQEIIGRVLQQKTIELAGSRELAFDVEVDIKWLKKTFLDYHPNGLRFRAMIAGYEDLEITYYSIGGGQIIECLPGQKEPGDSAKAVSQTDLPYHFSSSHELLTTARENQLNLYEIAMGNELARRSRADVEAYMRRVWSEMQRCMERGCQADGVLPGGLGVKRRAGSLYAKLTARSDETSSRDAAEFFDWVSVFALAVSEENAAGSKVTAPTNAGDHSRCAQIL